MDDLELAQLIVQSPGFSYNAYYQYNRHGETPKSLASSNNGVVQEFLFGYHFYPTGEEEDGLPNVLQALSVAGEETANHTLYTEGNSLPALGVLATEMQ